MPQKRFTPEQIIEKRRHADVLLGQGKKVGEVVKALKVTEVTDSRWRREYGGMTTAQAKAQAIIRFPHFVIPTPKAGSPVGSGRGSLVAGDDRARLAICRNFSVIQPDNALTEIAHLSEGMGDEHDGDLSPLELL